MSLLNQLFSRDVFGSKCKTSLHLSISRIKLLRNKRDMQLKHMRKEIAQFLQAGQEAIARIRVEHVIREQSIQAAYDILELFCEFVLARVPIIESQKDCPAELREAISSIIFSASRCSEVPDLLQIKNLFTAKYGKEFTDAASELRPDSGVNRTVKFSISLIRIIASLSSKKLSLRQSEDTFSDIFIRIGFLQIIEKLSVSAPSGEARLKVLKEIAHEYNLNWDSSSTEAEFSKKHEDLLGGTKNINGGTALPSPARVKHVSFNLPPSNDPYYSRPSEIQPEPQQHILAPKCVIPTNVSSANEIQPWTNNDAGPVTGTRPRSSEILEIARAAIASAERASAAARSAAELVKSL